MKHTLTGLVFLATLSAVTFSAPVHDGVLHKSSRHGHLSSHRRLSHRVRAAYAKRPVNLTFMPINAMDDLVRVELDASQTSDSRFSATLSRLGHENETADAEHLSGDAQAVIRAQDVYRNRHVMISIPDSLVWALQQRGIPHDGIPHYVRQNVHVVDPNTGNQYQLVPGSSPEESVLGDTNAIMITLKLN